MHLATSSSFAALSREWPAMTPGLLPAELACLAGRQPLQRGAKENAYWLEASNDEPKPTRPRLPGP